MSAGTARQEHYNAVQMFQPDEIAPAQFYATTRRTFRAEPEFRLLAAILEDAVATLTTDQRRCSRRQRRDFKEAMEWISCKANDDWVFSFVSICETLSLDAEYLRSGLIKRAGEIAEKDLSLGTDKPKPTWSRRKVVRLRTG